jgi:hypothetical protein
MGNPVTWEAEGPNQDPAAQGGYAQGELRAFEVGLLRGRDR